VLFALVRLGESRALPWFLPGVALSFAVALTIGGRLARALGIRRATAAALVVSLGIILSATLSPLRGVFEFGAVGTGSCDFSRVGLAPLRELLAVNDTSLNVVLFLPLGAVIAFLPRSRLKAVVAIAAVALPFAIETTQLLVPFLDRGCESADVVDNLTGLVIGLCGGAVAGWLAGAIAQRSR
jgi:glycopeptide antibiotics resistance protein